MAASRDMIGQRNPSRESPFDSLIRHVKELSERLAKAEERAARQKARIDNLHKLLQITEFNDGKTRQQ